MEEDVTDEALNSQAGPIDRGTGDIEQHSYPGQSSTTTVQLVQLQVWASSPDVSKDRNTGDTERPEDIDRGELDCLANTPGADLYSTEDFIKEPDLACGPEQLGFPVKKFCIQILHKLRKEFLTFRKNCINFDKKMCL